MTPKLASWNRQLAERHFAEDPYNYLNCLHQELYVAIVKGKDFYAASLTCRLAHAIHMVSPDREEVDREF